MEKIVIKDFYNKIIGTIEVKDDGDKVAKDFFGKILGYYRKKGDITTDFYGRIIGKGDLTSGLIWGNNQK